MRLRLLDRITVYERGALIAGRVAVSFEAALLHEPLGRDGVLSESLLLAAAAELAWWAAAEASGWTLGAELAAIEDFAIAQPAVHAELLEMRLAADGRFTVQGDLGATAAGVLRFASCPLAGVPHRTAEDWEVLRGTAA